MGNSNAEAALMLGYLAALREEIRVAIDCISRDALHEFELSLWRQEMLCAQIKRANGSSTVRRAEGEMRPRILEMCIGLKYQSQSYATLIERCKRSGTILRDLCYLYGHSREHSKKTNVSSLHCEA